MPGESDVRGATWATLSPRMMRHVIEQVDGAVDLSDEAVERAAGHFLVPTQSTVHFAAQRRELGGTTLLSMTLSAMRVCGAGFTDPRRQVYLVFVLSGAVSLTARGGETVRLPPGGSCVVADWGRFDVESASGTRGMHIILQRDRLADRGVQVRSARFGLDGSRSLRTPLRGFALAIADASWSASAVGELVAERTIEDLAVGMFLEAEGFAMDSEDLRAGLRGRALAEIAAHHRSPDLNPAVVAAHLSVSLRHLQRAFEHTGLSVAHAIASRRAESAELLLVAPAASGLTMDEIALRSGFSSGFELRAAFRDRYGMLPSAYRGLNRP